LVVRFGETIKTSELVQAADAARLAMERIAGLI
jgi:hypothetical protein